MHLSKNSIERAILIALLGGALLISPMGGKVVVALAQYYFKKWWEKGGPYIPPENDPEKVRDSLYKLKRNAYINWQFDEKRNLLKLELTPKGKEALKRVKLGGLEDISIPHPKDWDGQWRFLFFDIPEKRRGARDILRAKLKSLGFFRFQKSVWIFPFEYEKEIDVICEYLDLAPYVMSFTVKIKTDRILRRYFLKQGILLRRDLSLFDKGARY